jgi:NAD(P)-dependent dehydrogenase (short-subunit alcohol dehydrogenase family)
MCSLFRPGPTFNSRDRSRQEQLQGLPCGRPWKLRRVQAPVRRTGRHPFWSRQRNTVRDIAQAQSLPTQDLKAAIIDENKTSLLERFIEPDEIANLVVYLSIPLSSATNGAAVRADGGVLTTML